MVVPQMGQIPNPNIMTVSRHQKDARTIDGLSTSGLSDRYKQRTKLVNFTDLTEAYTTASRSKSISVIRCTSRAIERACSSKADRKSLKLPAPGPTLIVGRYPKTKNYFVVSAFEQLVPGTRAIAILRGGSQTCAWPSASDFGDSIASHTLFWPETRSNGASTDKKMTTNR